MRSQGLKALSCMKIDLNLKLKFKVWRGIRSFAQNHRSVHVNSWKHVNSNSVNFGVQNIYHSIFTQHQIYYFIDFFADSLKSALRLLPKIMWFANNLMKLLVKKIIVFGSFLQSFQIRQVVSPPPLPHKKCKTILLSSKIVCRAVIYD